MKHLKLFFALFAMLALGAGTAWAEEVTYVFTSKDWKAKIGSTAANWTSNKAGAGFSNNGIQVTTAATGANGTSPISYNNISQIVVTYNTNTSKGKGTLSVKIGDNAVTTNNWQYSGNANGTSANFTSTFDYSSPQSGKVTLTANTTTNSIYVVSIKIVTSAGSEPTTPTQLAAPTGLTVDDITSSGATLSWNVVENASSYSVTVVDGESFSQSYSVTETTKKVSGLTPSTDYLWTVTAVGDGTNYTNSEESETGEFTTSAPAGGGEEPGTSGEETWTLVTNGSDLKAGDIIVIASNTKGLVASNTITSGYMGEVSTTFSADKTTITTLPAEAAQLTIGGTSGAWTLTYDGKQLGATTVKKVAWDNGTKTWSITIANDGGATIQNGTNTYGRFLHNVSSTRFTTYTSDANTSMLLPQIYKKVTSSGETPETSTPSVDVDPTSHTFATTNVGETATQEFTITTKNTNATLTASIDDNINYAVSAIDGNKVTVTYQPQSAATHPAVLTVKAGEEATATVNLTGKAVAALEGTWILVTDASSLNVGDKIIIAAKESDVALSTTQADNNRPEVAITKNDNTITATSETQVLTLQAGNKENTLALYTGDGYLYAASSGSNWLRTETTLSDNSSWSIAVAADGTATLIAQGDNTRNTLYYNKNSKIFSCYSNAQQPIALYKNTNGKQLARLAYATTKYLTKFGDAFTTPTLTNPNSLTVTYSSSDNNVATVADDGTITIKAAGVVKITASFAGNSSFLEGSASYTIGVTEHAGTETDPYTVADAKRVIDVLGTVSDVYATGIVSQVDTYNSTYKSITYWISVDGTSTNHMQVYGGLNKEGEEPFSSKDDIKTGDEVVVKGNLKLHDGTVYEFDANNQLVSLNRTKQQAGLAYAETELTANVGEDFTEPTLTNPNSLTVTYSSSNTTLATVNETSGEVSILAAGKVTITASSAADATYAAGSASYNITISDPSLAVAQLPFYFDGKRADIEGTAGMTQSNLGTDYAAAPYLKFNTEGAWAIVQFDSEPGEFSFLLKQNGESSGTFTVYESENGEDYTPIWSGGDLGGNAKSATIEPTLSATARYVKFEYTTKPTGTNYGLGEISIKKADHRQEAGLVWSTENVSITLGDAFTRPTLSNPNGLTLTCTSDNENLATVTNAGVVTLKSGVTGKATITAKFDGNSNYKDATVTCTITVNPKTEIVVILAQYNGQWYALKNVEETAGKVLAALPVNYVGGKLYNVEEADKATIEWQRAAVTDGIIFKNGENYIYGTAGSTDLKLSTTECAWTLDGTTYKVGNRTFIYRAQANGFKNYNATTTPGTDDYSSLPVVTAPVYATGTITQMNNLAPQMYGTICLENNVVGYEGITFYKVAGKEGNKVIFDEVTELEAGMPYIYIADSENATIVKGNETVAEAGNHKSLQGTFTQIDPAESNILTGNYILYNNVIKMCGKNCGLKDHKAYFIADELGSLSAPQAQMPGRRRVSLNTTGENAATGIGDVVVPTEQATKVIINGQLIIIRDGEKFNVQGQRL